MISYYCDGKGVADVNIGLLESIEGSDNLFEILVGFALEVQAAHLLMVLRASQLIESLATQKLMQDEVKCIEEILLKYSNVDTAIYDEFKRYMETV